MAAGLRNEASSCVSSNAAAGIKAALLAELDLAVATEWTIKPEPDTSVVRAVLPG
jgi:hypothetical protein